MKRFCFVVLAILCVFTGTAYAQFNVPLRIKDEGVIVTPTRYFLNFVGAGVACADDAANVSTTCTISGGVPASAFPLLAPNGTAAAPSYSFSSASSIGMWSAGVGVLSLDATALSGAGTAIVLNSKGANNSAIIDLQRSGITNFRFFGDASNTAEMEFFRSGTGAFIGGLEAISTNASLTFDTFSLILPAADLGTALGDATHRFTSINSPTINSGASNLTLTTNTASWVFSSTSLTPPLSVSLSEVNFSAYNSANLAGATAFAQTVVTNASTLVAGSNMVHDIAGTGTGTFVAKLCSDGTTCAGGNVYLTCTAGANCATAAAGRIDACTITKSAVAAATTLTWSVTTACGTTDPGVNLIAHMTQP